MLGWFKVNKVQLSSKQGRLDYGEPRLRRFVRRAWGYNKRRLWKTVARPDFVRSCFLLLVLCIAPRDLRTKRLRRDCSSSSIGNTR